jgi:hypothetical protein
VKKLVCDRCGKELTEKFDVELAIEGAEAWYETCRLRGVEARGVLPCENYVRCRGEMILVRESKILKAFRHMTKADSKEEDS